MNEIIGLKAAGEYLNVSRQYISKLIAKGKLEPKQINLPGQPRPVYVFQESELKKIKDAKKGKGDN